MTENAYTPLNFVDPATGKAVGWEYDAVNEICRRLNCVVDWKLSSWDAMIPAVKDGQFDVGMDGITINDERKTQVDFSDPYMTSQQFMLVRADEARFKRRQGVRRGRQAADRRAGRHHQLLLRGLQRARRRRSEPAHQALRDLRRVRAGAAGRRCRHGAHRRRLRPRLHRRQPRQAQDRRRRARHRGLRLHLQARLRPRRTLQRRHRPDEGRRLPGLSEQPLVLPDRPQPARMSTTSCPT